MKINIYEIKGVIFDLDGTLVDTAEVHRDAWLLAMKDLKIKSEIEIEKLIGKKTIEIAETLAGKEIAPKLAEIKTRYYLDLVKKYGKERPCATEIIRLFQKHNIKIAVVTSSNRESAIATLSVINFYPEYLVSSDDINEGKPSAEPILKALNQMNLRSSEVIGIGDTIIDLKAYTNASLKYSFIIKGKIKIEEKELKEIRSNNYMILQSLCELKSALAI
ncbi:MAG: HAD family phosphatase [Sulfolobaceae archaeon]|nr:HAD family phosphatase [Sulfolobaceae archaeon]